MGGARPFGVISGSPQETRIAFFKKSAQTAFDWRERFSGPEATKVFRFAARCEEGHCSHYADGHCSLGQRVTKELPPVVDTPPPCLIRPSCRWHAEQGSAACLRCPQIVTMIPEADTPINAVAAPR
jgi:hypothetical protein